MKLSLQITSRNFELTDAIKAEITEKVEKSKTSATRS